MQDLKVIEGGLEVYKGFNPCIDSYSAFWDNGEVASTGLLDELKSRNVTDVYVCGLATDICVNFTATHACKHNFRVVLGKCAFLFWIYLKISFSFQKGGWDVVK